MDSRFPLIKMGQFLRLRKEFFSIDDAEEYQLVTVQLHARGVRERSRLLGSEIKTKKQQRVKAGDLLVAEIDAKVGGYGIVPPELDGAIVSGHYFLYEINQIQIVPEYLSYYLQTGYPEQDLQQFVKGSVNYAAIRSQHFFEITIPLPSLKDQHRIVNKLRSYEKIIQHARTLQDKALHEVELVVSATARNLVDSLKVDPVPLGCLGNPKENAIQTGPFGAQLGSDDFTDNGVPVITIGNVQPSGLKTDRLKYVSIEKARKLDRFRVREGDLLFARMGTVGRSCVVPNEAEGWLYNYHLIRVRLDLSKAEPHYIHWVLHASVDIENYLDDNIIGATRQGVNSKIVYGLPCRVPSLQEQYRIMEYLENLQKSILDLRQLQMSSKDQLNALLPSVLDKAFGGSM